MNITLLKKVFLTISISTIALLVSVTSNAQLTEIPKTPDGKPDFSGIWQAISSAHWDIEPHIAAYGAVPESLGALTAIPAGLGIVEGGRIPYTDAARRQRDENKADAVDRDPLTKCYMPGVPRGNLLPFPFQIVQSRDVILIAHEFAEANRILYVDQPELESQVDAWMGHSNAHWEGDTLVVRVSGQMPDTWFDRAGNHHSYEMIVEERWTYAGPNHVNYQATITDPSIFTRPWTISLPLYRNVDPDMQLLEFKCVEFAEEYMYGQYRKPGTTRAGARP
ncbi:MAG: hypothetical protein JKY98_00810 [Gammaproteobacteria bacterium]|nr:hypothetical protein [Gammaproteobacteria bacterium]